MSEHATSIGKRDVDEVLERLRVLTDGVRAARLAVEPLERSMADAHSEFQAAIGPLRRRELALRLEIEEIRAPAPETVWADDRTATVPAERIAVPQPTETDPELVDKDVLLEHIVRVLDPMVDDDAADLVADLQRTCSEPRSTLGEVLEQLPWGPAWSRRPEHEPIADQYRRLVRWERALERRLEELRNADARMQADPRHGLLRQRERGQDAWKAFLEQAAQHHRWAIADLEAELADLRAGAEGGDT